MTPEELDELERLMTAATPGPWLLTGDSTLVNVTHTTRDVWTFPRTEADMVYLGGLLNAAPALIAAAREVERLRDRIAYLEAGLDAIRRHHSAVSGCLPTCAATVYVDDDCDCGYVEADLPRDFAAAVLAGEADLSGALQARSATLR